MIYKIANVEELNLIWDSDIKSHPDDDRYIRWKEQFIRNNVLGNCITFLAIDGIQPIGQATLLFKPDTDIFNNNDFCSVGFGYVMGVRIDKKYEGQGHVSKLFKLIEEKAIELGLTDLIIGAEWIYPRTVSIYKHFGFDNHVGQDKKEKVLWLHKRIVEKSKKEIVPVIETERLMIKPFVLEQAKELSERLNDFELVKCTNIPFPYKEEYAIDYIKTTQKNIQEGTAYDLAVFEKKTNEFIGSIGLVIRFPLGIVTSYKSSKCGEIGYWIRRDKHGQGFCSEAAKAIIDFGFTTLNLHKIIAKCISWNKASEKVMIKCGLEYEGLSKSHILQYGVYEDVSNYGILRETYLNKKQ